MLTKQENLLGRSAQADGSEVSEARKTALSCGSQLGFMVMGLISGLSLANGFDAGFFLVAHPLLNQDGCQ